MDAKILLLRDRFWQWPVSVIPSLEKAFLFILTLIGRFWKEKWNSVEESGEPCLQASPGGHAEIPI